MARERISGLSGWHTRVATEKSPGKCNRLLSVLMGDMKRTDIQEALALRHEDYFREAYLVPALRAGVIELTIPDKPQSSRQRYRLTQKGRDLMARLTKESETGGKRDETDDG